MNNKGQISEIRGVNGSKDEVRLLARQLDIGYPGDQVVTGINLKVSQGQALALVGTNGSGKTTLLKTIVGLLAPLQGELRVLGTRPGGAPRRLAYLSQFHASGFVLPLLTVDVVRMGRFSTRGLLGRLTGADNDLVVKAIQTMGIERLADAPLRSLSGGQQQRVYLAQVLARQADLLVLDEPNAGLDAAGREICAQALRAELSRGATIVVATHDIQQASECDQVLLLARRVVAIGSVAEVLTPELLLETFGITLTHTRVVIAEGEYGPK